MTLPSSKISNVSYAGIMPLLSIEFYLSGNFADTVLVFCFHLPFAFFGVSTFLGCAFCPLVRNVNAKVQCVSMHIPHLFHRGAGQNDSVAHDLCDLRSVHRSPSGRTLPGL